MAFIADPNNFSNKILSEYSFDEKEDLLGYVFCSSFLLVL